MKLKQLKEKTAGIITVFLIVILSLCLAANVCVGGGLGIAPTSITISDALKGETYTRTLMVFNCDDKNGTFSLSAEGECADWISFYLAEGNLTIPVTKVAIPAMDNAKIVVKVDIPEDTANGNYTPTVYAQSIPKGEIAEGMGAMAVIRISSTVLIQVTGMQILKGVVKSITTADTELGYPLKIKVEFRNEGNVIAKPEIAVGIMKAGGGELVDSFVHDEAGIKPDQKGTITVLWNTTGRETGDYVANVAVSLGNHEEQELLSAQNLSFKILPVGTFTRRGVLQSLTIEGNPLVNTMVKLVANFANTGEIDTMAKFKGEIYHEGNLLDVMESDEMLVETGETRKLTNYYKILESGSYEIKGRVFYAGKETEEKEVSFEVPKEEVVQKKEGIFEGAFALIAVILVILVLLFIIVRKRRKK